MCVNSKEVRAVGRKRKQAGGKVKGHPFAQCVCKPYRNGAIRSEWRMRLKKEYENIYGGMHGGCAFSLADTTAGVAVVTFGEIVTTLNAAVNYMKPITDTKYLYCDARVRRHGGRVSVVGVELTNDQGELLMDGSFTYFHLRRSWSWQILYLKAGMVFLPAFHRLKCVILTSDKVTTIWFKIITLVSRHYW